MKVEVQKAGALRCSWHKPHELSYRAYFEWADQQAKEGKSQARCPDCNLWYFPSEMGDKPVHNK